VHITVCKVTSINANFLSASYHLPGPPNQQCDTLNDPASFTCGSLGRQNRHWLWTPPSHWYTLLLAAS